MRRKLQTTVLLLLWTLFVLYPNPLLLLRAVGQSWTPVIDAAAVREIAAGLPNDPAAIEHAVLTRIVPYGVPWQVYSVPWYFPTPAEVLAAGRSDCQGRAVVFASILQAKGIPYTLDASFDHIWVNYAHKAASKLENPQIVLAKKAADGSYGFQWPAEWDLRASWNIERAYFLDTAPSWRLAVLLLGLILILVRDRLRRRVQHRKVVTSALSS